METLVKSKFEGLREAWAEEEKEREARQSQRLDTFAKVSLIQYDVCIVPFLSRRMPYGRKSWRGRCVS